MNTIKLIEYLQTQKEDINWVCEKSTTKAGRNLAQNRTFWKIFKGIGDKLGYSKEVVRTNILTALFGTYEVQMFGVTHLIPNKTSTTELDKQEGIQVIDGALEYAKKIDAGIEITSRDIQDLINSYN